VSAVDVLLGLLLVLAAISGYRQGLIAGALGFVGFLVGGAIGMIIAPMVLANWSNALGQALVTVLAVLICAAVGQALLGVIGNAVRETVEWKPARLADAAAGSVLSVVAVLVLAWFLALAFVAGPTSGLTRQLRASTILTGIDGVMPEQARGLFTTLRNSFDRSVFPEVFAGIATPELVPVPAPDGDLATLPIADEVRGSIVEVLGTSLSCDRGFTGSGFVYAPQRVLTNAHVVAGTDRVFVRVGGVERPLPADVVVFDPAGDVAVLAVPELAARPLTFRAKPAKRGDDGIVIGFPGGRAYTVGSARVREVIDARGSDIYDADPVTREIYALRTRVRPGNSGGPLIDRQGQVLGVVFAASTEDPETGYALTAADVADDAAQGVVASTPVGTGSCT
jgi:S1-C subfamily serine protease